MNVQDFLSRLDGVRKSGKGQWIAKCPAHQDRSPSLSVGEGDDGRVLIKCFAECSPADVVAAVGVDLSDLFPEKAIEHAKSIRYPAADVLEGLANEVMIVWIISRDMEQGITPSIDDFDRLTVANRRIQDALELVRGKR